MGNWSSTPRGVGDGEVDVNSGFQYRYPPKAGNYFSSHFIMGGEKFDSPQPESFLFGENSDLNYLGARPVPFPYPPPQDFKSAIDNTESAGLSLFKFSNANEPTKTLKALINIRRDSLHFFKIRIDEPEVEPETTPEPCPGTSKCNNVKCEEHTFDMDIPEGVTPSPEPPPPQNSQNNIVFTVDTDVKMSVKIYFMAAEEVTPNGLVYTSKLPVLTSPSYHFKKGAGQVFDQPEYIIKPLEIERMLDEIPINETANLMPIVIHCQSEEGEEPRQSHATIAAVDKHNDGSYSLKTLKQKLFVDGLCYLIQEIYGVERKPSDDNIEEDLDDTGAECVVCMCDSRDTLILPCRHLCLCNSCADMLRYQANNCPICRAPFRALLQIRALQKTGHSATHPALAGEPPPDGVPPGYELVSLVDALNGPLSSSQNSQQQQAQQEQAQAAGAASQNTTDNAGESNTVEKSSGKKKQRRRQSKEQQPTSASSTGASSQRHKSSRSLGAGAKTAPTPVEDPLMADADPYARISASNPSSAAGQVKIVNEKQRSRSVTSLPSAGSRSASGRTALSSSKNSLHNIVHSVQSLGDSPEAEENSLVDDLEAVVEDKGRSPSAVSLQANQHLSECSGLGRQSQSENFSQVTINTMHSDLSDVVEEELRRLEVEDSKVTSQDENQVWSITVPEEDDGDEAKEATTEDELLKDNRDPEIGADSCALDDDIPGARSKSPLDDVTTTNVFYDNEQDRDADSAVIVAVDKKSHHTGVAISSDTPRSIAGSLRSSQESASSTSSTSKLLLGGKGQDDEDEGVAGEQGEARSGYQYEQLDSGTQSAKSHSGGQRKKSSGKSRKKAGSVASADTAV